MIVCTGCGNANQTRDEFCGSCGAYLEWHGERVGTDPPPVVAPPPVLPAPEKPGLIERVRYVVGLDEVPPGTPVTPLPPGTPVTPLPPGTPVPPLPPGNPMPPDPYPPAALATPPPPGPPAVPPLAGPPALLNAPPALLNAPPAPPFGFQAPPVPPPPVVAPPPGRMPLPAAPPAAPIGPVAGSATVLPSAPYSAPYSAPPPIAPRPPEAEYERPPAQRPDPVDLGPADQYCGGCGAGNTGERRFCRRCGTALADVVRPAKRSWWRRLFGRRPAEDRPAKGTFAAGQRPQDWTKLQLDRAPEETVAKPRRTWRFRLPQRFVLSRFALPLIGLSVLGMGLGPMRAKATEVVFDAYHSAKRRVAPEYVHVTPRSATASDAARNHPATALIDRNTATYWSDGRAGAAGSVLTVTFDRPIELAKVGFHNGAEGKDFPFQPRVRVVEVVYLERGQEVARTELTVGDKPQFQTFDFAAKRVDSARVTVVSVYAGQKGSATSLAELSFLTVQ